MAEEKMMNRIQQILSKAERDGTARRLGTIEEIAARTHEPEVPYAATHGRATVLEEEEREFSHVAAESVEPVGYAGPSEAAQISTDAALSPLLVAALQPFSPAAEQYRSLRGRIAQAENGHALRALQVTSPAKGDGKT